MEAQDEARVLRDLEQIRRDRMVGAAIRGGMPRLILRSALPTASKDYEFCFVGIPGAAGAASVVYVCLKSAADTYSWKSWAAG